MGNGPHATSTSTLATAKTFFGTVGLAAPPALCPVSAAARAHGGAGWTTCAEIVVWQPDCEQVTVGSGADKLEPTLEVILMIL